MEKYVILSDVTCDLSPELRERFGVKDYVKGHVHFSDGRDFETELEWNNISREDFYKALSDKRMKVSTAPGSPEEYYEKFRAYAEQGYNILSMSISKTISSTYETTKKVAERVKAEFPQIEIYCLDSARMSGAFGLLVIYAYEMQAAGKSMNEVIEWLEKTKTKVHQMGPIDDLIFVARRGRISMGKAIMGSFAGVKPMGDCNRDGYVTVLARAKGMKKAIPATVAYVEEMAVDIENQYIIVTHSNREDYANTLKEMIEKKLNPKAVFITDAYSGCGTNIGPGMIGAYFIGNDISEDCAVEKEILNKVLSSVD